MSPKFKMNSKQLNWSISRDRSYWIRILRRYNENFREFSDTWKKAICKTPTEIVKKLALAAIIFYEEFEEDQYSPLHIAACQNDLQGENKKMDPLTKKFNTF